MYYLESLEGYSPALDYLLSIGTDGIYWMLDKANSDKQQQAVRNLAAMFLPPKDRDDAEVFADLADLIQRLLDYKGLTINDNYLEKAKALGVECYYTMALQEFEFEIVQAQADALVKAIKRESAREAFRPMMRQKALETVEFLCQQSEDADLVSQRFAQQVYSTPLA